MPSPTSSTRPTSRTSWAVPSRPISPRRTETISSGLNFIAAPRQQLISDRLDACPHRTVEYLVADLHDHSAQQVRLNLGTHHRVEPGRLANALLQLFRLGLGE